MSKIEAFMDVGEETITYERMMNALNESDGGVESRHAAKLDAGMSRRVLGPLAGVAPCPSEPDQTEMELAYLKRDLDALVANLSNPVTAARYAGLEGMLFSMSLSCDLIRSAAKADWPARAKAKTNVVDLNQFRQVPDEVA